mgnify:FL=1
MKLKENGNIESQEELICNLYREIETLKNNLYEREKEIDKQHNEKIENQYFWESELSKMKFQYEKGKEEIDGFSKKE